MKADIYETVTASIVAQLEQGARPWAPRWTGGGMLPPIPLRSTGQAYRGVNVLLLWQAMVERGYTQRRFITFKQAMERDAHVRKGERGTPVVFYGVTEKEDDQGEAKQVRFARAYTVFNVAQVEGLGAEWFDPEPTAEGPSPARLASVEAFLDRVGADVRHGGTRAFYQPGGDFIQLPVFEAFTDAEAYYATRAHETVHWTGHESRCARTFGKRFGDQAYAVEELVAEMGAAFLCAELGVSVEPRADHAAYLASWLEVLKADKRAVFTAASAAQSACDHVQEAAKRGLLKAA